MKRLLLSIMLSAALFINSPVMAEDFLEDYLDITANYCVTGQYDLAMEYLDKILLKYPDNKQAMDLKRGLSHVISGDKKTYILAVNPSIKNAQEYKRLGNTQGEYESLINGTQNPNAYLAHYYLGNFYRDRLNYSKALDSYNAALSARPNFAQAYLASALTLFEIGKYESALNPIEKYISLVPNDDLAYATKSRIEFQLGMMQESTTDIYKAISINDCPEYQFDRAKLLYKQGNYSEAKNLFTKLLPNIQTSKIYEYMGFCDLAMNDYMSALMNIDKAIILSNDDEFLENKYNEIKRILESNQNAQKEIQTEF
ncbi:MAG: tetratricopeptide repeat protein [Cyanobacteria bacterium SIG26]|nr:tetratricopeptide repeat protein [Cyanobacteria bacterium SIG26]